MTENFESIIERLKEKVEIATLIQTTGRYNLMAICMAGCVEDMRYFINKLQKEIPEIIMIKCDTILDVIKGSIISID